MLMPGTRVDFKGIEPLGGRGVVSIQEGPTPKWAVAFPPTYDKREPASKLIQRFDERGEEILRCRVKQVADRVVLCFILAPVPTKIHAPGAALAFFQAIGLGVDRQLSNEFEPLLRIRGHSATGL
jgi:hypothetical protein